MQTTNGTPTDDDEEPTEEQVDEALARCYALIRSRLREHREQAAVRHGVDAGPVIGPARPDPGRVWRLRRELAPGGEREPDWDGGEESADPWAADDGA
jgi:hypothetical protein